MTVHLVSTSISILFTYILTSGIRPGNSSCKRQYTTMSADPGDTTGADPEGGGGGGGGRGGGGVATPPFKSKPYLPGCTFCMSH